MSRATRIAVLMCIFVGFGLEAGQAEVPHTITFQGRMKDSTGTAYTGAKIVKFIIYGGTGTEVWNSGFQPLTFDGGLVTVQLGAPPHPVLPDGNWVADTALTLGITVDTDPEITPRIPFTTQGYAFHARDADQLDGLDATGFVHEAGDTMSGALHVVGNLSVGTDSSISPLTVESQDNWSWVAGDGWGDVRIGDSGAAFNIGVALGGGGRGATRIWSKGGLAEDIYLGSPTSDGQILIKGVPDQVNILSDLGINTQDVRSPLTLQSQDKWRWDIDSGNGDFRIGAGNVGFNIGIALAGGGVGATRFWTEGGLVQQMLFGGDSTGDVLIINVDSAEVIALGDVGVGTSDIVAPLTVRSQNQFRWDMGAGLGDFRLANSIDAGLSMGIGGNGETYMWSTGGLDEDITIGSPTYGNIAEFRGADGSTVFHGMGFWQDSTGSFAVQIAPDESHVGTVGSTGDWTTQTFGNGESGNIFVHDSGEATVQLLGRFPTTRGGGISINRRSDASGVNGVTLTAGSSTSGGAVVVHDTAGTPVIELLAGLSSDESVQLPNSAINADEMLNEPGFAMSVTGSVPHLVLDRSGAAQNILTVTLTTPADGYVVVEGQATFLLSGTTAANYAWMHIDTATGTALFTNRWSWSGSGTYVHTGNNYYSASLSRAFFLDAGSHTFYLEGNGWIANDVNASTQAYQADLRATYHPTSYGTVAAGVFPRSGDGGIESASTTQTPSGQQFKVSQIDLRDLELRAKDARIKVLEAKREAERLEEEIELARARADLPANAPATDADGGTR